MIGTTLSDIEPVRTYAWWTAAAKIGLGVVLLVGVFAAYLGLLVLAILAIVSGCISAVHFKSCEDVLNNTCCCGPRIVPPCMFGMSICNVVCGVVAIASCVFAIVVPYLPVAVPIVVLGITVCLQVVEALDIYWMHSLKQQLHWSSAPTGTVGVSSPLSALRIVIPSYHAGPPATQPLPRPLAYPAVQPPTYGEYREGNQARPVRAQPQVQHAPLDAHESESAQECVVCLSEIKPGQTKR